VWRSAFEESHLPVPDNPEQPLELAGAVPHTPTAGPNLQGPTAGGGAVGRTAPHFFKLLEMAYGNAAPVRQGGPLLPLPHERALNNTLRGARYGALKSEAA
jgi:hypothetical protein